MRRIIALAAAVVFAAAFTFPVAAGRPTTELSLVRDYLSVHGLWTDEYGVECLSDENTWERTWWADKFTGSLTASVYLCPVNPNAPAGPNNIDIWASFAIGPGKGSASLTLTYPNGMVVAARYNPVTTWTEVCMVRNPSPAFVSVRMPGVYTMTFSADSARSVIVHLDTDYAENVRGQYWWGCDPSWWL